MSENISHTRIRGTMSLAPLEAKRTLTNAMPQPHGKDNEHNPELTFYLRHGDAKTATGSVLDRFWGWYELVMRVLLGRSGDLVNLLSNGPYGAYNVLLWWLMGDTKWTY